MENNTVQNVVHGFKVFRPDWTCDPTGYNPKQYTCPGKFEEEGELDVCGHGMHFCQTAADCFNYYSFNSENKVAEVIAYGEVRTEGDNIYFLRKRVKYSYRVITLYFHTKMALSTATCNIEERRTAQDTLDFVQTLIMNI